MTIASKSRNVGMIENMNALQSETTFLRNEILSKNTIIKMLTNDTNHNTHNATKPDINVITENVNRSKMNNVVKGRQSPKVALFPICETESPSRI